MKRTQTISAFLVGLAVSLPIYLMKQDLWDSIAFRFVASALLIGYVVAWFVFVHGPADWDRYRWVPRDGIGSAVKRGVFWLIGAGIAISVLETVVTDN